MADESMIGGGTPALPDDAGPAPTPVRARFALAALAGLCAILIGHSLYMTATAWPFRTFSSAGRGMAGVLEQQSGQSIRLSLLIGLAARDAAGGRITELRVPSPLTALASGQTYDGKPAVVSASYLRQASGETLVAEPRDPFMTVELLAEARKRCREVRYPMDVYGFAAKDGGDGRVVLFTDARHVAVFAVPASVVDSVMPR